MTIAVLFHRIGPYHRARLEALSDEFVAVEFSKIDNTYPWDILDACGRCEIITIFSDMDVDTKHIGEVRQRLEEVLGGLSPSAVAIPGWSSASALVALAWCCTTRTPVILMSDSTEQDEPRVWWKEWIKSRVVRLCSAALVAGNPHIKYVTALGVNRENIYTGYDVVDNDYFLARSDEARANDEVLRRKHKLPPQYFLASNRFIDKKNLPRLLYSYAAYVAQVGEKAWSLVILGDGPQRASLFRLITQLGLSDYVRLPGFKQYDNLPIYYGLARVFIHASTSEQWGLVVNEAMASGLPVLVSNRCGCASDLVQNGVNGYVFNPYDIKEMTGIMVDTCSGTYDLASMGHASRDIISNWSVSTFAAGMNKAVGAAMSRSLFRANWFDQALLWMLMRR